MKLEKRKQHAISTYFHSIPTKTVNYKDWSSSISPLQGQLLQINPFLLAPVVNHIVRNKNKERPISKLLQTSVLWFDPINFNLFVGHFYQGIPILQSIWIQLFQLRRSISSYRPQPIRILRRILKDFRVSLILIHLCTDTRCTQRSRVLR